MNNAGIVGDGPLEHSPEDFDAVIKVHLRGTWGHASTVWPTATIKKSTGEEFTVRNINATSGAGLPATRRDQRRPRQGRDRR